MAVRLFTHADRMKNRKEAARVGAMYADAVKGYMAFQKGLSPCVCMWELGTPPWVAWYEGWHRGYRRRFENGK